MAENEIIKSHYAFFLLSDAISSCSHEKRRKKNEHINTDTVSIDTVEFDLLVTTRRVLFFSRFYFYLHV